MGQKLGGCSPYLVGDSGRPCWRSFSDVDKEMGMVGEEWLSEKDTKLEVGGKHLCVQM